MWLGVNKSIFSLNSQFALIIPLVFDRWRGKIFFLPPYAAAGFQTHVSRVAPTRDLLKDTQPTELPCRGKKSILN